MKHPPYHLRANKAVDRIIFMRLIDFLGQEYDLRKYKYYGLGGPFLEDIRLLHDRFPWMNCVSIEKDSQTYKRQKFHKNTRSVKLVKKNLSTFITQDFESEIPCIFWLDHTDFRPGRFDDFVTLMGLLEKMSVAKITLRAQPSPWDRSNLTTDEEAEARNRKQLEAFNQKYSAYLPRDLEENDFTTPKFQHTVESMVRIAAERGLDGSGDNFVPAHSCRYSDGTMMVSVTGVLCPADHTHDLQQKMTRFRHYVGGWGNQKLIDVPELSIKERLHLEKLLPIRTGSGSCLSRALRYKIDNNDESSEKRLRQYMEHYDCYPMFLKVGP